MEVPDKDGKLADVKNNAVTFTYVSKDGEEGYPGTLSVKVTYSLTNDNELKWEAEATTDAPTVTNLVHHSYWNLTGDPRKSINDHELVLHADEYLPTNAGLIPLGTRGRHTDGFPQTDRHRCPRG
jgi:aldose 1-epimerase